MDTLHALILNVRKYTGNSVVVDCYTQERGRVAFMYSFTKANKGHKAIISPMGWINFVVSGQNKGKMQRIKELQPYKIYRSISINPIKSLVALFLSEVISSTLKEEHPDPDIFHFLKEALYFYDETTEAYDNFHLCFLTGFSAMQGIAPPVADPEMKDSDYLLWEGRMNANERALFKDICLQPIDLSHQLQMTNNERSRQLTIIVDYLKHYATGFKEPKSLAMFRDF